MKEEVKRYAGSKKNGEWAVKWGQEFDHIRMKYNRFFRKNNKTIMIVSEEREEQR